MPWPAARAAGCDHVRSQWMVGYLDVDSGTLLSPLGHCRRGHRLWIGSNPLRLAMLRIDVTNVISRPGQDLWDFFVDLTNSPRWTQSGSELRPTSQGPLGLGTTIVSVRTILGLGLKDQTCVVNHV